MLFQTLLTATYIRGFSFPCLIVQILFQPIAHCPVYGEHEQMFIAFLFTVPLCLFEDFKGLSLCFNHLVLLYKTN